MRGSMTVFLGLMIPLAGTTLGSACVFFLKDKLNALLQKGLLGFASGVMVAASVWSLLIPSTRKFNVQDSKFKVKNGSTQEI